MLFADILIRYLIETVRYLIKARGSDHWPKENATALVSRKTRYADAEIIYSYTHEGRYCSGTHEKMFRSLESAKRYVASFPTGSKIVVRVKPGSPQTSIVYDDDQD